MVGPCLAGYPLEACGLLGGPRRGGGDAAVTACYPAANAAASSRVYTVEPRDMLRADREAEEPGREIVGVWHSHTHTDAYPSPTDMRPGPGPGLVLRAGVAARRRAGGARPTGSGTASVEEEPVAVQ